ncbi:MAG: neutral/alkaline non-lysosomal ceramidase N-terminal domain-containing protein [Myxococcota bacterium]
MKLPIGTPLSGYSARCTCLSGYGKQDDRESAYTTSFIESTGVHTWPTIKVVWLSNGDDQLVITKTDTIYSADELVTALTARLEAETGEVLAGRVVHTANHSHASFGTYAHGASWFLGSDRFDRENFERMVDQIAAVALEARDRKAPAKLGVGWAVDWDPNDDVYHDRRGENDALAPWGPDSPPLGKDPHLGVIRIDALDDTPIAVLANFGMHGILSPDDDSLVSGDAGLAFEVGLEETFGEQPVVAMFVQGSGGDASPGGRQGGYAAHEALGELGAALARPLYDAIVTSADPIRMETVSRAIYKDPRTIRVTRDGAVDWTYAPYDDAPNFHADDVVYADDGSLATPIDEFNTQYGSVFCGSGDLAFPVGGLPSEAFPYHQCLEVELMANLVKVFFRLDELPLPLIESLKASTTTSRLGPLPTRRADGTQVSEDLFVGFFPGEPVYSFGEQWRRRVLDELGIPDAMMIGYSQDHEGYLLMPEDWLMGGYEPDIGLWGPLEAEYVLEQVLAYGEELLLTTDLREDPDPLGQYAPTTYPEEPYGPVRPDLTPAAGTWITTPGDYLWTPFVGPDDGNRPHAPPASELGVPATVARVQGLVQVAWEGGDVMVDSPEVVLERQEGSEWAAVTTAAGRRIDEGRHDIWLAHTPTPLYPVEGEQTHQWWAAWQAVSHWDDRAGLPLGTYRLRIAGHRYGGAAATWPWDTEPYTLTTDPFEVVPAEITVTPGDVAVHAALVAPPHGYRMIHLDGDYAGENPLVGPVTVEVQTPAGTTSSTVEPALDGTGSALPVVVPSDWTAVTVTDTFGNRGTATR